MATIFLLAWPVISFALFRFLGFKRGLIVSVLAGYLLLPPNFSIDLPVLPAYEKRAAIAAGLFLGLFTYKGGKEIIQNRWIGVALLALFAAYILNPFLVVATNTEPLFFGSRIIPGMQLWDVVGMLWNGVMFCVPLFMGYRFLRTPEDHRLLMTFMVWAGFAYSFLVLFEARMSPQLSIWIYGYFPHSWIQHVRGGAFRPIVFLSHGLAVGLLLLSVLLGSIALSREVDAKRRMAYLLVAFWLFMVLLVSRNFGAVLLALVFAPLILLMTPGIQTRIAAFVAIMFLCYPIVRQSELLPINNFVDLVSLISPDRAGSFQVRLENEQELLARALEKPLFGWGGFGRGRIYNEYGTDVSLVDGLWIGVLGARGWVGYISLLGMIALPVIAIGIRRIRKRLNLQAVTAGFALIMAANFVDLVPNSTLSPLGLLMAGALAGFITKSKLVTEDHLDRRIRYTRFEPKVRDG